MMMIKNRTTIYPLSWWWWQYRDIMFEWNWRDYTIVVVVFVKWLKPWIIIIYKQQATTTRKIRSDSFVFYFCKTMMMTRYWNNQWRKKIYLSDWLIFMIFKLILYLVCPMSEREMWKNVFSYWSIDWLIDCISVNFKTRMIIIMKKRNYNSIWMSNTTTTDEMTSCWPCITW